MAVALVGALGCAESAAPKPPPPPPDEIPAPPAPICLDLEDICAVPLATYDGSGQVVHPDVAVFRDEFAGHTYWLAATPYPNGNAGYENPSIFTDLARRWGVPNGLVNPVVPAPGLPAYNSDPDVVYDPDAGALRMYYRLTSNNEDQVLMRATTDGVRWTSPVSVAAASGISIVSPAVVRMPDGRWAMWSVRALDGGCLTTATVLERRTSPDGIRWSAPVPVDIDQSGYVIWHLDVQYVPAQHEFWALYAAYPVGAGCAADDLFFARSADGITWRTYSSPIVGREDFAPFRNAVYRSSFFYDAEHDAVRLFLSGAVHRDDTWIWTMATSRWRTADLLAHVGQTRAAAPAAGTGPSVWNGATPATAQNEFP